jgi:hypothetical protein
MKTEQEFKIVCPFCNAAFTAEMETDLDSSMSCETCGPGPVEGTIDVICTNCKKLVYRKEI